MKEFSLIIPCYNECKNIELLFKDLEKIIVTKTYIEIIIVDNGSSDDTLNEITNSSLFKNKLIKLIKIKKNKGYGHGIKKGIKTATGNVIGWCHGDLQTSIKDVILSYENNIHSLNKANCVIKGFRTNRSMFDSFFTKAMAFFVSTIFNFKISDINAQPKIFPKKFLKYFENAPDDFSLDLFFLLQAKKNEYSIIEHPLIWYDRKFGVAKGGGSLYLKFKLTLRTVEYLIKLKKRD
jgi:polyisoprenyl-phosphate glycosyltransferase